MNVTVNSQELAAELRQLNKVVPAKPPIAILAFVRLEARDGLLHFYATDLEVSMQSECPGLVGEPGVVALPMAKFLALVEQFQDAPVTITKQGDTVRVQCQGFKTNLQTLSHEDFPSGPEVKGEHSHFDAAALRELIPRVRYAIAPSGPISVLKGALLSLGDAGGAMVSTDTKRIALTTFQVHGGMKMEVIVPAKTLDLLASQDDAGTLEFVRGERHLFFTVQKRRIASRMIDAEFPNFRRAIPKNNDKQVIVNRALLSAALKRVVLIAEDDKAVFITLGANTMTLDSASASVGAADEVVPCAYSGPPLKVCVNGDFVLDFLEVGREENVTMSLGGAKDPMMITDGPDHTSVILLIRK